MWVIAAGAEEVLAWSEVLRVEVVQASHPCRARLKKNAPSNWANRPSIGRPSTPEPEGSFDSRRQRRTRSLLSDFGIPRHINVYPRNIFLSRPGISAVLDLHISWREFQIDDIRFRSSIFGIGPLKWRNKTPYKAPYKVPRAARTFRIALAEVAINSLG